MSKMEVGFLYYGIALMIIFSCFLTQNLAQVGRQECMNELQSCLNYFNGNSHPPDSCCRPLDYVIKSMPECLCSLMSIQGANEAEQAGINITEAQTLPGRCGQHINPLGCVIGTPDTRNSVQSYASSTIQSSVFIVVAAVAASVLALLHAL
ncbi:hypothetical protein ACJIZ3_023089 [Penstemon smallii]|uniref:Bifunctional inhibitor/plant lipid transfer protein/seed storage helical domain-containing protein n=1 Tax=Penstemon smallii TaxID=265156 RepID=A0ABD3TQF0_9LAMI